jgi:hypothetical protein
MKGLRGAFATLALAILVLGGIIGISAWSPWESELGANEVAWMQKYANWHAAIGRDLGRGRRVEVPECRARFDRRVGDAPAPLASVYARARGSCVGLARDDPRHAWRVARWNVIDSLVKTHTQDARTTYEPRFSRIAGAIARRQARVYCWESRDWTPLAEQWDALRTDEFWVLGIATPRQHRIDLSPEVCVPLRTFYAGGFVPYETVENLDYSEGLIVLAHEAEHIRQPFASEAVVECHAIQRVRDLVRDAGHGARYQAELAGLALVVSYPNLPDDYKTRNCYSGGPYDLHPGSKTWP